MRKVLIIAGSLQRGGIDHFCVNISRYAPKGEFEFHYVVYKSSIIVYKDEIEKQGGRVFLVSSPVDMKQHIEDLASLMKKHHYDAIHSNTHFSEGICLAIARYYHVPIRIAHSHMLNEVQGTSPVKAIYRFLMRMMILKNATHLFACSKKAGDCLYGEQVFREKGKIINNGIEVSRFLFCEEKRDRVRKLLSVEENFVIGHVGHMLPVKNHIFLINVLHEIMKKRQDAIMVFLGDGPERERIENTIREKGLENKVLLLGSVENVNEYLNVFDCFVLPSLSEGAPISLVEAQTNGLPCIVSENIPPDVFISDLIVQVPLYDEERWVNAICKAKRICENDYASIVSNAGFSVETAYLPLYETYRGN